MRVFALLSCLMVIPAPAFAQASVAGTVTDPDGLALAHVAVEATSPVLIERVRPGAYTITFARSGWRTAVTTGVELAGSLTATVDVQLLVGALDEAVTV